MLKSLEGAKAESYRLQEAAIHAFLHGSSLERARVAGRAAKELFSNPEQQTEKVFALSIAMNKHQYLRILASQFLIDEEGSWLLEHRPALDTRHVDLSALRALPAGTLGREYAAMLDAQVDVNFVSVPPGLPPMISFLCQRMRQTHDIWHVLTGYQTDAAGEIELHGFYWGQTGLRSSALIAVVAGVMQSLKGRQPDLPGRIFRAYRRGRRAAPLLPRRWETMWERPLAQLKAELRL